MTSTETRIEEITRKMDRLLRVRLGQTGQRAAATTRKLEALQHELYVLRQA